MKERGMTVAKLISKLQSLPPETEVWFDKSESLSIAPVKSVSLDDDVIVIS